MTRICIAVLLAVLVAASLSGDDSARLLTIDHFVRVKSTVPAIAGQQAQLYVRERVMAGMVARGSTPGRSRRPVRPRRGHAGRSRLRRAERRLQLDGLSRARRLRRLLGGHDRLRPIDAAGADERPVQPGRRISRRGFICRAV